MAQSSFPDYPFQSQRIEIRSVTPVRATLEELFLAAAEGAAIQAESPRRSA